VVARDLTLTKSPNFMACLLVKAHHNQMVTCALDARCQQLDNFTGRDNPRWACDW
jgi:hypothetical protein